MYQTIEVKSLPWTNTKPRRFKAISQFKSITWSLSKFAPHMNDADCAIFIAEALATQLGWSGKYHGGVLRNGNWVFVIECSEHVKGKFVVDESR